jgi:hypothetical protein
VNKYVLMGALAAITLTQAGCPGKVKSVFSSTAPPSTLANSKLQVENDGAMADGISAIIVLAEMRNQADAPVSGFTPEIEVDGEGVTTSPCTATNNAGISVCVVKATEQGIKTFKVTNADGLDLKVDLNFTALLPQTPGITVGGGSTTVSTGTAIKHVSLSDEVHYERDGGGNLVLDANGDPIIKRINSSVPLVDPSTGVVDTTNICYKDAGSPSNSSVCANPSTARSPSSTNTVPASGTYTASTGLPATSGGQAVTMKAVTSFGEPLSAVDADGKGTMKQQMLAASDVMEYADAYFAVMAETYAPGSSTTPSPTQQAQINLKVGTPKAGAVVRGTATYNMQGVLHR